MMKFRRMRWVGYVACMGEEEWIYDFVRKGRRKEITRKTKS
jgi:hypothetical protein